MAYDLLIKNGTVVDGSGLARYRADVAVQDGKIAAIGRMKGVAAKEEIDAEGHIVAPGFVDGHTHMDAQIFWDPIGSCSCYHGVTTVVMGNCGFTLAPCREAEADLVFRNLERAEDLSPAAMRAGIKWSWETFPEYLDVLDSLPKGINYAGYVGHSALRTYVMGERAFSEAASDDDLVKITAEVKAALKAGAIGVSTTRSRSHETSDNRPVASRLADWREIEAIVGTMSDINAGIFQIAPQREIGPDYIKPLMDLAVNSGRTVTMGVTCTLANPDEWEPTLAGMEAAAKDGGRMFAQVHAREIAILISFETNLPWDHWTMWREWRKQPLEKQKADLGDPAIRAKLVEIASAPYDGPPVYGAAGRPPVWEWIFPFYSTEGGRAKSIAHMAKEQGKNPVDVFIDEALKYDLKLFFRDVAVNGDQDEVLKMMKHPRAVVTFSDSGAHVSQIMDSSIQTHLLSYWTRERQAFTLEEAVRKITYDTASHWGFSDRGLLREGMAADLCIFDADTIGAKMPEARHDLPSGAPRLFQGANGILATVVNGQTMIRNGQPTGNLPGKLLRAKLPG
jgi:N-acyl-D-aspartate/D-glutamate deacylase